MNEMQVKILLVEDSPSDARLLCESLQDSLWQAFEIVRAERLDEALALMSQGAFDVILLDLTLPDSRGMETCRRMSQATRLPIIILTGAEDERIITEAMHLGVQDYLVKGQSSGGLISRAIRYAAERGRVQQALRESEEDLHRAQAVAQTGSWRLDLRHHALHWSQETYRIFGIAPGTPMTYELFLAAVHPEDREELARRWTQAVHGMPYDIEHRILVGSQVKWVREKAELEFDTQGVLHSGFGTIQDITERKLAEEALRRSEERVRATFNNAGVGLAEVEQDDRLIAVNDRLCEILGYERAELLGKTIHELTVPEDRADSDARNRRLHAGQTNRIAYDKRYLRRDGTPLWVHVTVSAIHDADGRWLRSIGTIEDISERRRAEDALRELMATLENKVAERTAELEHRARQLQKLTLELSQAEDRERRRLAEILHDDLQQVLAAAKFHLGLVDHRVQSDPAEHARITQIDHMLADAIAKSRSLSHELSPAVLHHNDLAETLGWLAHQMQTKHGLAVTVETRGQVRLSSDVLGMFLYKVAQELLFNVVKHARVNQARIRARRQGRCIYLSVSDRGRGFEPQDLRETAGFGLFSIRERVGLLGGRMKIRSTKGRGSTFFLVVPDTAKPEGGRPTTEDRKERTEDARRMTEGEIPQVKEPLPSSVLRSPSSVLRVILADDHEIVREGLALLLREASEVEVVGEAANGREAVNLAYTLRPDVVVMDVSMPVMSGVEATRQIKTHLPAVRVVALSMFEEPEVIERMRQAGAESYVLKTDPSEELLAAIRGDGGNAQIAS